MWGDGWEDRGGVCCGGVSDRMSEMHLWGEQLDQGATTLPTLSSLSRINGSMYAPSSSVTVQASLRHEHGPAHMHTLPPSHTLSGCLIYADMIGPRHATFTLNNVEGRNSCFWFPTKGRHLNGSGLNTQRFCLFEEATPKTASPVTLLSHFK